MLLEGRSGDLLSSRERLNTRTAILGNLNRVAEMGHPVSRMIGVDTKKRKGIWDNDTLISW